MKTELNDVSLLIALKIDSDDRVNNLDLVVDYLLYHFNVEIIICEQGPKPILKDRYKDCVYVYEEVDEFFNRQKGVNIAARKSNRPIIGHYDADIVLDPYQINKTVELLRNNEFELVLPYNGYFYDVPKNLHKSISTNKNLSEVTINDCELFTVHGVGGVVFFKREVFWKCGGANENFKGLGYEDNEIFDRFRILKTKMARINRPLFHLNHVRLETSYNYNPFVKDNEREYLRISRMSKEELSKEIETWSWSKK